MSGSLRKGGALATITIRSGGLESHRLRAAWFRLSADTRATIWSYRVVDFDRSLRPSRFEVVLDVLSQEDRKHVQLFEVRPSFVARSIALAVFRILAGATYQYLLHAPGKQAKTGFAVTVPFRGM